ncbi:hypothetical protein ACFYO1_27125 [Nocardia sp. NPDC006044]|uniref:hypothetical protein n=1 Tax=Nocardia sp. NPDC006044 TaxID=3364306 RepID=UPI00367C7069
MPCRPAHLAAGLTAVAALVLLAPTAHAVTSPSYRCTTIEPGKEISDNLAPVTAGQCTPVNKAPKEGDITGLFFILDATKKEPYYLCGVNPDGRLAPATTATGTATLPGKVTAKGCKTFPKGDIKFTPEQFEQELAKQTREKGKTR